MSHRNRVTYCMRIVVVYMQLQAPTPSCLVCPRAGFLFGLTCSNAQTIRSAYVSVPPCCSDYAIL